jgi:hypothetical protein
MFSEFSKNTMPLNEYIGHLLQKENTFQKFVIKVSEFKLNKGGGASLTSKDIDGNFKVSIGILSDLADLAKIPDSYFFCCDTELKAISFNSRVANLISPETQLTVIIKDGMIYDFLKSPLSAVSNAKILDTISSCKPDSIDINNLRVAEYFYSECFDVSIISPEIQCEPVKGDTVAFGINVRKLYNGATLVHGAALNLIRDTDAINAICPRQHHYLKRPQNNDMSEADFLENIAAFSRQAWSECHAHVDGLKKLTTIQVDISDADNLKKKLTVKPFLIPLKCVELIIDYLKENYSQKTVSLYDLYNSLTHISTHQTGLTYNSKVRLRFGAGEISRRNSRICDFCHPLVLEDGGNI